ncbi:MAG TPA: sulfite exporter TauE/SafE family protein [Pseudonocardiaceae bacterium]|nr:sulfite exporter TauE/SafE family protein [Pseudonocardiaceae bacterium]
MTVGLAAELFGAAVLANALGSAVGMAGGIFVVPVLIAVAHTALPVAIAVSLVSVVACSCASAPRFLSAGIADLRLAIVLETATATGAFLGVLAVGHVPARALLALFSAVLAVSAVQIVVGRRRARAVRVPTSDLDVRLRLGSDTHRVHHLPLGLGLMLGAGLLSTLLGIGSGILKIPAMDMALRLPFRVSSATANLMIGVTAAGGAAAYLVRGEVTADLVAPVVLGSVAGSLLGAPALTRLPTGWLRTAFTVVLVALAVLTAWGVAGSGPFGRIA